MGWGFLSLQNKGRAAWAVWLMLWDALWKEFRGQTLVAGTWGQGGVLAASAVGCAGARGISGPPVGRWPQGGWPVGQ